MSEKAPRLELRDVLAASAEEIRNARSRGRTIHRTRDIRAAGNEVEQKVREVVGRWLPVTAGAGHGHIVDRHWHTSPQLDLVLTDRTHASSVFRSEDGTEYFPYEAVYGFGEVKTTFDSSKQPVKGFSDTIRLIRESLDREATPPDWIPGVSLGDGIDVSGSLPYRNPLLTFMLFADPGDFDVDALRQHYQTTPTIELPTVLVVLGRGVVTAAGVIGRVEGGEFVADHLSMTTTPEFLESDPQTGKKAVWIHLPLGESSESSAAGLGFLYATLLAHLKKAVLMPPDLLQYMHGVFDFEAGGHMPVLAHCTPASRESPEDS